MAIREGRRAFGWPVLTSLLVAGCSVANLSFTEVQRDIDAIVRVEGSGADEKLVYESHVRSAPWYLRAWLLLPIKPFLRLFMADTTHELLENPSQRVRDLLRELGGKAGTDLMRGAASVRYLVRVAELDPSALNRIVALDGLETLANAYGVNLVAGLEMGPQRLIPPPEATQWRADFVALLPIARNPAGALLSDGDAARYRGVLAGLTSQPLPSWTDRLALVVDLAGAMQLERDPALLALTRDSLRHAMRHAIQWTIVGALQGRDPDWVEVRVRALELLYRSGGPDAVPLLLALLLNSPDRIAAGEPPFDTHETMRRRLIHLCGQLDRKRALRSVVLPGRENWQVVCPAEFLARIALEHDTLVSPMALLAREALAQCLVRRHTGLDDDPATDQEDWVAIWYADFSRQRAQQ
jgi:hypothetical protein